MSAFLATTTAGGVAIFAGRAAVALGLGAMIGLERQWRQRMAGLRTNALVALGSALFELLGVQLAGVSGVDATRIAAYVVSGIGFLGAGVILRDGGRGRGSAAVRPRNRHRARAAARRRKPRTGAGAPRSRGRRAEAVRPAPGWLHAVGGIAPPAAECTAATAGTQASVPYTADYYFWKKARH